MLQQALRVDLPGVSTHTIWHTIWHAIWCVPRRAGLSWQKSRTWSQAGLIRRVRDGTVEAVTVTDPDADAKKKLNHVCCEVISRCRSEKGTESPADKLARDPLTRCFMNTSAETFLSTVYTIIDDCISGTPCAFWPAKPGRSYCSKSAGP